MNTSNTAAIRGSYNKSNQLQKWGLIFHYTPPKPAKSGLFRSNVSIMDPGNPSKNLLAGMKHSYEKVSGTTIEKIMEKIDAILLPLASRCQSLIFERVRSGAFPGYPLELYVQCNWDKIILLGQLTQHEAKFRALWDTTLAPVFGQLLLPEFASSERLDQEFEHLWPRKKTHREMSDEESNSLVLLSGILGAMYCDNLLAANPLAKRMETHGAASLTEIKSKLNRPFFEWAELQNVLRAAWEDMQQGNALGNALLLILLLGVDAYEVCGLDVRKWGRSRSQHYLEITQEYYQNRESAKEPIKRDLREAQCRRIPCTTVIDHILAQHLRQRNAAGGTMSLDDPLLTDSAGNRLQPNDVKEYVRQVTALYTNKTFQLKLEDDTSTGLRRNGVAYNTAGHYLRRLAGMDEDEVSFMSGNQRASTYGEWYVDWGCPLVIGSLRKKAERWHSCLFDNNYTPSFACTTPQPCTAALSLYCHVTENAQLHLLSAFGAAVSIREAPKVSVSTSALRRQSSYRSR